MLRLYRANTLFELQKQNQSNLEEDILDELKWLDGISLKHLKNYQIWYMLFLLPLRYILHALAYGF